MLGRRVVVYGGGDTAMDAARTAKRLGASDAIVVYRRTRERMPAHDVEVEEALEEGVRHEVALDASSTPARAASCSSGWSSTRTGFPQPTGELEELEADSLVLALGQEADLSLLDGVPGLEVQDGVVEVDAEHDDRPPGDLRGRRHGARRAHGHGRGRPRQARRAQHRRLAARRRAQRRRSATSSRTSTCSTPGTTPTRRKTVAPRLDAVRRQSNFAEVQLGLDEGNALFEARRCLSCGNCFECDNCYGLCPDNAVIKLDRGERYEIDYDYCKGCGICAQECPCGAIEMVPEPAMLIDRDRAHRVLVGQLGEDRVQDLALLGLLALQIVQQAGAPRCG